MKYHILYRKKKKDDTNKKLISEIIKITCRYFMNTHTNMYFFFKRKKFFRSIHRRIFGHSRKNGNVAGNKINYQFCSPSTCALKRCGGKTEFSTIYFLPIKKRDQSSKKFEVSIFVANTKKPARSHISIESRMKNLPLRIQ